jgi:hypothetical protein
MPEARILTGGHSGHTHYECDVCNQWFETEKEMNEHGMKVHSPKIPAA